MSINSHESTKSSQEVAQYWTPQRLSKAKPVKYEPSSTCAQAPAPQLGSPPIIDVPGFKPGETTSVPEVLQATPVPHPTRYPWCTIGKLFFTASGEDWVGSACVIARFGLLTVAHNLYDGKSKTWSENIRFCPAYTNGDPFGWWSWNKAWVRTEWYETDQEAYDVGLIRLNDGGVANRPIGDVVGWLGYTLNRPVERSWTEVGYPTDQDHGQQMVESTGYYTRTLDNNQVVGKQGDLRGGASGGPWLLYGNLSLVNGLHSFHQRLFPAESFSPYFSDWVGRFIQGVFG